MKADLLNELTVSMGMNPRMTLIDIIHEALKFQYPTRAHLNNNSVLYKKFTDSEVLKSLKAWNNKDKKTLT